MDVLHYSFSLSACPKCHLLVCKHTSLANLDFRAIEQQEEKQTTILSHSKHVTNPYHRLSSHGMNFYVLPSIPTTTTSSNNRHSWTTFGTDSNGSNNTLENLSLDHDTLSENIPFSDEPIIHSTAPLKPQMNQIVRTQSERCQKNYQPRICLTRSYSFSTICTTPKSNPSLTVSPRIHPDKKPVRTLPSNYSLVILSILILSYLLTNTLDIVLLYIYYHTTYLYFLSFTFILFTCDIILWINSFIEKKKLPTHLLLIPFVIRLYLLYELVELIIILMNQHCANEKVVVNVLSSTSSSSSTTTTLETNISQATDSSLLHTHRDEQRQQQQEYQSYKKKKQRLYHYLTLFYLIHSSLLVFINLYFWSNHFQISPKSQLNMDYFLPQWTTPEHFVLASAMNIVPVRAHPVSYWSNFDTDWKHSARRTVSLNWTHPLFYRQLPISIRLPSSTSFILTSIFYHLLVNYCLLSIFLTPKSKSWLNLLRVFSRFCLIIARIYTFIFLFRLNAWWFALTFFLVHVSLMFTLLIDRTRSRDKQTTIFLKLIFSFLTHSSIDDISINALISLENISIFLHRLYLETFSSQNETTFRLIVFLSVLISLQIIGFLLDIFAKRYLYLNERADQTITKV